MRSKFDEQLDRLNKELIEMGALCERAIAIAAKALEESDPKLGQTIIPLDDEISQKERTIESLCLKMLLQQQPVARDLRQISAALKIVTDMERIGRQAADIAEILGFMNGHSKDSCTLVSQMAKEAIKMVTESVDAYVKKDLELARNVVRYDDVVDDYFQKVKGYLIELISENKDEGEYAIDLLMIAKYFERIGDHATNIAQWVEFSVTGVHRREAEI